MTFRQFQVLGWLAHDGDLTQSELAERMEIEAATVVGIIDRMERDGWIARCADPRDRRKNVIRPTPQVEPIWKEMVGCLKQVRSRAVAGLNADELKQLWALLGKIQHNVRTSAVVPGSGGEGKARSGRARASALSAR